MTSPQDKPSLDPEVLKRKKGLILIYTGDGKGKTSAAFGAVLRALGWGMKVSVIQFIKGGWQQGELRALKTLSPNFELIHAGEGFTWDTKNPARDRRTAEAGWKICAEKIKSGAYDLLVFDEMNCVLDYGYLDVGVVRESLEKKPPMLHVILTGRNAKPELIALADIVTDMKEVKHVFRDRQIPAQRGIDF